MYRLSNDPMAFSAEATRGLVMAYGSRLVETDGGLLRATEDDDATVAVVIGGGSGHFPAFAGLVGPGLAHAAVLGNIFASPSARQIAAVASEAHRGRGVVLLYGNYAGDVLSFDEAERQLRANAVDVESVPVTDDISSAPASEQHRRRGLAGDLVVMKIAGAAAAAGHDLADVAELARRANRRTRTLGVAFGGCTLPGATEPLFTVPEGRMAMGMGLHGEPGIYETERLTSAELAPLLVDALLAECPPEASAEETVVVVNGLGATKYEELFLLYAELHDVLTQRDVRVVDAEVGEFVTSFDMAGVSVTLFWPDEELRALWDAPVDAISFRRGKSAAGGRPRAGGEVRTPVPTSTTRGDAASQAAARVVAAMFRSALERVRGVEDELGRLDAIAGDGDHGIGMRRGSEAAAAASARATERGAGAGATLAEAARAWGDAAGGTSGALWSAGLAAAADTLSDTGAVAPGDVVAAVEAASRAVLDRTTAQIGDKTLLDPLLPFVQTLTERAGEGLATALAAASEAAMAAAVATADLVPAAGRARSHPGRSLGIPDPGAVSFANIIEQVLSDLSVGDAQERDEL